jgi:hypothetical protein
MGAETQAAAGTEQGQTAAQLQMNGQQLLTYLKEAVTKASEDGASSARLSQLTSLFTGDKAQTALRDALYKQWLMAPEEVSDKENVEKFYAKLSQQMGQLDKALSQMPGVQQSLASEVSNIYDNVEFMNQLNQTVSYVQLPLRFAGENTHGDLYVYTNKRNLASDDGNVSAFLHLDMDHLGPVDVYVAMQQQKVSTQFYLRDDEMIDFIGAHISMLEDRLSQKGYQMNVSISQKDASGNVMEEIMEDQKESMQIGFSSFDMRA